MHCGHQPRQLPLRDETHPPLDDYCASLDVFLERYARFESLLLSRFPACEILIENRCGTEYQRGSFLVSKGRDLLRLSDAISPTVTSLRCGSPWISRDSSRRRTTLNCNHHG